MKNDRGNIILSKSDIQQLRMAYNNKNISDYYLNFDVANIMKYENVKFFHVIIIISNFFYFFKIHNTPLTLYYFVFPRNTFKSNYVT